MVQKEGRVFRVCVRFTFGFAARMMNRKVSTGMVLVTRDIKGFYMYRN